VDDKSKYTIFAKDDRQAILHTDAEVEIDPLIVGAGLSYRF
jgi:outer membrane protein W